VLGPLLVAPPRSSHLTIRYWRRSSFGPGANSVVDFVPTSGSLMALAAWRRIGAFREDYFVGGIDVEWGYRAWHGGWTSAIAEDISLVHRWGEEMAGTGFLAGRQAGRQSPARLYYYMRNAAHGMRLPHMPLRWKLRQSASMAAQIGLIFIWRRKAMSARLIGRVWSDGGTGRLGRLPADLEAALA
jgi:rhamnosyltransferase